ncbi:hypothetical protein Cgig2_017263 [Carnegiea gigantea]|uniref:Uncharacterized protein n=1 Tax=Carnegiea gigantea TaxID=171969 RepID=A0A9Q1GYL9_9CARY|nr:hypothetical protein Cgig2_017263 [Carnegiea gigantea]
MECGNSSTNQREVSMDRVNNCPNARVLFGSIKVGGEGISLVGTFRIIILDVHFNPSVSHQAIRHAFQPGQGQKINTYLLKVQLFRFVLEDKGAPVACKGNCEQQNSLEAQSSDTPKMLNVNVNKLMKHVVDNKTAKSNKHMTNTCAKTYIAHPSKSSEKKESPMQFENAD